MADEKIKVGFFSFTCCQGCQFTILFLDNLMEIFDNFQIEYFHILKEKNRNKRFDVAFVEGAITTKKEIKKLKKIRNKSKFLVAIGACACYGGIPSMKNFIENKELQKYVYSQRMLKDSIDVAGIGKYVKADYYMRGCPIIKEEFVDFVGKFRKKVCKLEFKGPVCNECPRRGKNCYLLEKKECLGALTHGGCNAICIRNEIPCILCRGPLKDANFAAEISLFKSWGLKEKDIKNKIRMFEDVRL